MKSISVASLILSVVSLARCHESTQVISLSPSTLPEFLEKYDHSLVMFYAPWCGHCQDFLPEFDKAQKTILENEWNAALGKVDCTVHTTLRDEYKVQGYPTIYHISKGRRTVYKGGRVQNDIINYISTRMMPPYRTVTKKDECTEEGNTLPVVILETTNEELKKSFESVADANRGNGLFCLVDGDKDLLSVKHSNEPEFEQVVTKDNLAEVVERESIPLFNMINADNYRIYYENPIVIGWVYAKGSEFENLAPMYRQVARDYRGSLNFVLLDAEKYQAHAKNALGIESDTGFVIENKGDRYVLPDSSLLTDKAAVKNFVEDYLNGNVKPHIKSEAVPPTQEGNVRKIVGATFKSEVVDAKKDVLLKVHAPWCGHCAKLVPVWKEVADQLIEKNVDVLVAEFNNWANDLPKEWQVKGFPTIVYIPKDSKQAEYFEGNRSTDELVSFAVNCSKKSSEPKVQDEL